MTLIETQGLSVHHGRLAAIENIDFSVSSGKIVTVVGPNGSGKTTLLRAIIGAIPLTSGSIQRRPLRSPDAAH